MNFIDVDNFITSMLCKNIDAYNSSKCRLDTLNYTNMKNLKGRLLDGLKKDKKLIDELKFSENILYLYKRNTSHLIKNFINVLKTPISKNDPKKLSEAEKTKKTILFSYLNVVKVLIPYEIIEKLNVSNENNIDTNMNYCENCDNTDNFIKDNDILICSICYSEVVKMAYYNNRSYNVNISKCNYDRISHFKECLKQFQGKQNTFINPNVYTDIEHVLKINGILVDSNVKEEKFNNVKKRHIIYFLKELGYTKHYDDYVLIYHNITNKTINDISHLEEKLICDFEKISEKYSSMFTSLARKNFINIQFILYKLLQRHNYQYDSDDFISIKSADKKMERETICKSIFESLNWEYNW